VYHGRAFNNRVAFASNSTRRTIITSPPRWWPFAMQRIPFAFNDLPVIVIRDSTEFVAKRNRNQSSLVTPSGQSALSPFPLAVMLRKAGHVPHLA
jgi:hypothetical protein